MRTFLAALILAASLSMPAASSAEAGFWTSVAKGAVDTAVRRTLWRLRRPGLPQLHAQSHRTGTFALNSLPLGMM